MPAQTPILRQDAATAQAPQASSVQAPQTPAAQAPSSHQNSSTALVAQAPAQTAAPPQSAAAAQVMQTPHAQTSAVPEPQYNRQSESKDTDMDGDDGGDSDNDGDDDPNNLSHNEKLAIIRAISNAPEEPEQFRQAFARSLPFPIDFRVLQLLIHPDKYQDKEKDQANVAFQKLLAWRENTGKLMSGEADRHTNFFHGNDTNRPKEHVEGELSLGHKHLYQLATPHLRTLFFALGKNPRLNPHNAEEKVGDIAAACNQLDSINAAIKAENQKQNKDSELGTIRYVDLFGLWRPMFLQPELKASQTTAIIGWCQKLGYPTEWATFGTQTSSAKSQPQIGYGDTSSANSQPQAGGGDTPGNSIQLWNSAGGKIRTIAIVPRKTTRSINPGYTSSGEKIHMIQNLGLYSARFVVEDAQGGFFLRSSAAAGGQPAVDGAKTAGVPSTLQKDEEIMTLRNRVRAGGQYGLNWVAVGEWNPTKNSLPFIVVGFWHQGVNGVQQEAGLSRAALKKILAPREAERLIAESMISDPDLSLKEALYEICPDTRPAAPLALPGTNSIGYP